jgi:NAD(P)-dependent dehydrogenase (short-subunit alcohol dehydrogenase family)
MRLKGRIALVTGASRGIGRAVAKRFAAEGAHLILVARTEGGLIEADDEVRSVGGTATLLPLDLAESARIDELLPAIKARFGRLDVLVGNAAILGTLTPVGHIAPDEWQRLFEVNVTANWRLIRGLDSLLREGPAGRAIFVTSGVAARPRAYWGGYSISKAALEALVRTYSEETATTSLRVNLVSPGPVRTAMRASAMPGEDPQTLPHPDEMTSVFVDLAAAECTRHGEVVQAYREPRA